jgi:hypothetical protein
VHQNWYGISFTLNMQSNGRLKITLYDIDIRSVFGSRQSTSKEVEVTGFQLSRLQAAFRIFYGRYNDLTTINICRVKCTILILLSLRKQKW